ncbi:MAG: phytanoyl-CoA dioxygenase family protein [Pseudomarimonas sp.]
MKLDLTSRALFHSQGWLHLPSLIMPTELDDLRDAYEQIIALAPRDPGRSVLLPEFSWVDRADEILPQLQSGTVAKTTVQLASQLVGTPSADISVAWRIFHKAARSPQITEWHQDRAFESVDEKVERVTVWVPLDAADTDSGGLWYVPGSHLDPPRLHRRPAKAADDQTPQLVADVADVAGARATRCVPGDVLVHHELTLHASGANRTAIPRRVFSLICRCRRPTPASTRPRVEVGMAE